MRNHDFSDGNEGDGVGNGRIEGMGRVFAVVALIEALTWAGLLIGMALKYSGITDLGVWLFGRLHGVAFMAYVVITVMAAVRLRWPIWAAAVAILAAIPPLVTWPLEIWFRRINLLAPRKAA